MMIAFFPLQAGVKVPSGTRAVDRPFFQWMDLEPNTADFLFFAKVDILKILPNQGVPAILKIYF